MVSKSSCSMINLSTLQQLHSVVPKICKATSCFGRIKGQVGFADKLEFVMMEVKQYLPFFFSRKGSVNVYMVNVKNREWRQVPHQSPKNKEMDYPSTNRTKHTQNKITSLFIQNIKSRISKYR